MSFCRREAGSFDDDASDTATAIFEFSWHDQSPGPVRISIVLSSIF